MIRLVDLARGLGVGEHFELGKRGGLKLCLLRGRPLDIQGGARKNFEINKFLKNGEKNFHPSSMYIFCYRKCEKNI